MTSIAVGQVIGFLSNKKFITKSLNLPEYCSIGTGFSFKIDYPRAIKLSPLKGGSSAARW